MKDCSSQFVGLLLATAVIAGCGDSPRLVPVSGTVYYNGKPVESGVVMFQPPQGDMARGQVGPDGKYVLETLGQAPGVLPGTCKVRVSVRATAPNSGGELGLGKLLIPEKYTDFGRSGLTFDVTTERQEPYDIYLEN
jgi:hypothetical protein